MEEIIQEVMQKYFRELKDTSFQIKRILQVLSTIEENSLTLRLIIVKRRNTEDMSKALKASRKEQRKISYHRLKIRTASDFSSSVGIARRQWSNALKLLKKNNIQPRFLYPDKQQFRVSTEKRHFQICNDSKHSPPMSFLSQSSWRTCSRNKFWNLFQNVGVNQESGRQRIQKQESQHKKGVKEITG